MSIDWKNYDPGEFYDELISTPGYVRAPARNLTSWLRSLSHEELQARKVDAELAIIDKGAPLPSTVTAKTSTASGHLTSFHGSWRYVNGASLKLA